MAGLDVVKGGKLIPELQEQGLLQLPNVCVRYFSRDSCTALYRHARVFTSGEVCVGS
jgi:hypothetical protein